MFKIIGNAFARYAGIVFLMLFFCALTYKATLRHQNQVLEQKLQAQQQLQEEQHLEQLNREKVEVYNMAITKSNIKLDLIMAACTEANAVQINQIVFYCVPIDQIVPPQENSKHDTEPKKDEYIL